jgi:hypothetical protein
MLIQDFTVLKSVSPITIEEHPSKKTIEALGKIIADPQFHQFRELARKGNAQPPEGFSIKLFVGQNLADLPIMKIEGLNFAMQLIANTLRGKLGLGEDFQSQAYLLMFFDTIIDLEHYSPFISESIKFILGKKHIASTMYDYPAEIGAILVPYSISKRQLVAWIDSQWDSIQQEMNNNLPGDPYALKIHKNIQEALEIMDLHDNKKLSFIKIATQLSEKYPNDDRFKDDSWVKQTYYDYKTILNSLPQRPNPKK